jgi:hypothetical protein
MNLHHLTTGEPLSEARQAVHRAVAVVAAFGLGHGGQGGLAWDSFHRALVGERVGPWSVALRVEDLTWLLLAAGNVHAELAVEGRTLEEPLRWIEQITAKGLGEVRLELPGWAVEGEGAPVDEAQLAALSTWFDAGYWVITHVIEGLGVQAALVGSAEHLALTATLQGGALLVGVCAGVEQVPEPHFFVHGRAPASSERPRLERGAWSEGAWTGGWLAASHLVGASAERVIPAFLTSAIGALRAAE